MRDDLTGLFLKALQTENKEELKDIAVEMMEKYKGVKYTEEQKRELKESIRDEYRS